MDAERKVQKAKITLMRAPKPEFRFWSGVMMVGKTEVVDDMPTACTNGRDEFYGRAFIEARTDKEVAFVVLHENMHKGKRDLTTWAALHKRNPRLANMALDYVINLELVAMDPTEQYIAMPRHPDGKRIGLYDRRFAGMDTYQVFRILEQEQEDSGGEPGDMHVQHGGLDEHDWDGAKELSASEKEELSKEIDRALRQGAMEAKRMGGGAGSLSPTIEDLLHPQVDWAEALREFVTSLCTNKDMSSWRRPNRRYLSQDIIMPTLVGESLGHVVLGADMSGSTWVGNTMQTIFTEMVALCQSVTPERLDLIYWDTRVAGREEYKVGDYDALLQSTKPVGGGGTDPNCVAKYLNEERIKPDCIVMVTDGAVPNWGEDWPAPILWVVIGNNRATASTGKTVHIKG